LLLIRKILIERDENLKLILQHVGDQFCIWQFFPTFEFGAYHIMTRQVETKSMRHIFIKQHTHRPLPYREPP